jgi:hypothetical protein
MPKSTAPPSIDELYAERSKAFAELTEAHKRLSEAQRAYAAASKRHKAAQLRWIEAVEAQENQHVDNQAAQ